MFLASDAPTVSGLVGASVRLWPYTAALYPPETLIHLWQLLHAEHAEDKVFWPQATQGSAGEVSVAFFLEFMSKVLLLIPQHLASGAILGFCWFEDIVAGHRAAFNMFYRRKFWGAAAREATAIATWYGHTLMGWPTLWGMTPWRLAQRHGLAVGWDPVATLPGYARIHGRAQDLYILRHQHDCRDGHGL